MHTFWVLFGGKLTFETVYRYKSCLTKMEKPSHSRTGYIIRGHQEILVFFDSARDVFHTSSCNPQQFERLLEARSAPVQVPG